MGYSWHDLTGPSLCASEHTGIEDKTHHGPLVVCEIQLSHQDTSNQTSTVKLRSNEFEGTNHFHPQFPKPVITNIWN